MNSKDLIKYKINRDWLKARVEFCEEQTKTIGKLNSILSDMPKGSRQVYDNEAESLVKLLDMIEDFKTQLIEEALNIENKATNQLQELTFINEDYGLILYHFYILGNEMGYIAKEIVHHEKKYTYKLKDEALKEFDKLDKENKKVESRMENMI